MAGRQRSGRTLAPKSGAAKLEGKGLGGFETSLSRLPTKAAGNPRLLADLQFTESPLPSDQRTIFRQQPAAAAQSPVWVVASSA